MFRSDALSSFNSHWHMDSKIFAIYSIEHRQRFKFRPQDEIITSPFTTQLSQYRIVYRGNLVPAYDGVERVSFPSSQMPQAVIYNFSSSWGDEPSIIFLEIITYLTTPSCLQKTRLVNYYGGEDGRGWEARFTTMPSTRIDTSLFPSWQEIVW